MHTMSIIIHIAVYIILGWSSTFAQNTPVDVSSQDTSTSLQNAKKYRIAQDYKIKIMGVIESKDPKKSVVLVKEIKTRKVQALKIGHLLLGKHPIIDISNEYIRIQDKKHVVMLHKNRFQRQNTLSPTTLQKASQSNEIHYREDGLSRTTAEDAISIQITSSYRDHMIQKNLQTILMQAAATPHTEEGQVKGFIISDITPGSIYEKAGFQNGDLVTAINSSPLSSASAAIKVLNSIKKSTEVEVSITRDNQSMDMSISVN